MGEVLSFEFWVLSYNSSLREALDVPTNSELMTQNSELQEGIRTGTF